MAEVPPHLLERSRARRAALGLATGEEGAPAPTAPAATVAAAPAGPASAAAVEPAGAAARTPATVAVAPPPSAPPPPKRAPRIPLWMMPVLLALPVWVFFYMGMFAPQKVTLLGPEAIGAEVYAANCASCHLSNGAGDSAGGVGRKLSDGEAELTFPAIEDQIAYVKAGSPPVGTPYGNPDRPGGQHEARGGMPGWEGTLTDEQIAAVVAYERSVLSGQPFPTDVPGLEAAAAE